MMKYIDMHTHTTASDGTLSPSELIKYAISKGLAGISITDHDTIDGIEEGLQYAQQLEDFYLLPGVELSTEHQGEEVHILGYAIDHKNQKLIQLLSTIQQERKARAEKIVHKLRSLDLDISYEEVLTLAQDGAVGRPHIARILVKKGFIQSIEEGFNTLLNKGCPAYVPRYKLTPQEAIEAIRHANGLVVAAHPGLLQSHSILFDLIQLNIDGIEVYHSDHSPEESNSFLKIAKENQLLVTGGSDFHQAAKNGSRHGDLGSVKVPIDHIIKGINLSRR